MRSLLPWSYSESDIYLEQSPWSCGWLLHQFLKRLKRVVLGSGTGLVQCFSIRNSFSIKIYEGRRGLWFHHACCQTRASASFSFQRLSLPGQQNDHSLQLSAIIPKHFISSQHREKIHFSFPILSTVHRVTTVEPLLYFLLPVQTHSRGGREVLTQAR